MSLGSSRGWAAASTRAILLAPSRPPETSAEHPLNTPEAPAGASVHKLGGLGYVGFAEEVRAQEAALGFKFDFIVVCTVTGSTHAGMVVGFAQDGRQRNVIGIDASATPVQTRAQVLDIAQKTSALIGGKAIDDDDVVLNEDYAYPLYGVPSKETIEAIVVERPDPAEQKQHRNLDKGYDNPRGSRGGA